MKTYQIVYSENYEPSPVTYWVHQLSTPRAVTYPYPEPVPGKGYYNILVELDGFVWRFASVEELFHVIQTLGKRHLDNPVQMNIKGTIANPTEHWLAKLPAKVKSWKYREKAVKYLNQVLTGTKGELGVEVKNPFSDKEIIYETRSEGGVEYKVVIGIREKE